MLLFKEILRKFLWFFVPGSTLYLLCVYLTNTNREIVWIGILALASYLMIKISLITIAYGGLSKNKKIENNQLYGEEQSICSSNSRSSLHQ